MSRRALRWRGVLYGGRPGAPPPKRRRRGGVLALLLVAGLAGLGGGGSALYFELTRPPTAAEVRAAGQTEIASRWQRLPAGRIFPATVSYFTASESEATASRAGIAPRAGCTEALDPPVAALSQRHGCLAVLRATYLDESGTLAVTVGVAVMPSGAAASAVANGVSGHGGIRAARLPGTQASLFGDRQRAWFGPAAARGPYVIFYAVGHTDGRRGPAAADAGPVGLGSDIAGQIGNTLTLGGPPCGRRDVRC